MITQRIDETRLVTLAGNTRPEVHIARDMGAVSDSLQMSHMYLQMKMSPPQQADVAALMNRLHDPASPEYHKWLSVADIEERFGPAEADVKTVSAWLESHGFTVNVVYRANDVIDFSGPASAIREGCASHRKRAGSPGSRRDCGRRSRRHLHERLPAA
jgi:hypothetical protein